MEQFLNPNNRDDPATPLLSKRVRMGILLFILAAILAAHFIYTWSDNKIRFDRIRRGMSREELETILQGHPDGRSISLRDGTSKFFWTFHDGTAEVWLDSDGKVDRRRWIPNPGSNPMNFFRKLLRKIGI